MPVRDSRPVRPFAAANDRATGQPYRLHPAAERRQIQLVVAQRRRRPASFLKIVTVSVRAQLLRGQDLLQQAKSSYSASLIAGSTTTT